MPSLKELCFSAVDQQLNLIIPWVPSHLSQQQVSESVWAYLINKPRPWGLEGSLQGGREGKKRKTQTTERLFLESHLGEEVSRNSSRCFVEVTMWATFPLNSNCMSWCISQGLPYTCHYSRYVLLWICCEGCGFQANTSGVAYKNHRVWV